MMLGLLQSYLWPHANVAEKEMALKSRHQQGSTCGEENIQVDINTLKDPALLSALIPLPNRLNTLSPLQVEHR